MNQKPLICALLLIGACAKAERRTPPPAAVAAPPVKSEEPAPAEPPRPGVTVTTATAASLVDDTLYACTEVSLNLPEESFVELRKISDASAQYIIQEDLTTWLSGGKSLLGDMLTKRRAKDAVSALRPTGSVQGLGKLCREQFPRAIIATCTTAIPSKVRDGGTPPIDAALQTIYYEPTADTVMTRCIASGSDWWEVARDSREYIVADAEKTMRKLHKHAGGIE